MIHCRQGFIIVLYFHSLFIEFTNIGWYLFQTWNSEQLTNGKAEIHRKMALHMIDEKHKKGIPLAGLLTAIQSAPPTVSVYVVLFLPYCLQLVYMIIIV